MVYQYPRRKRGRFGHDRRMKCSGAQLMFTYAAGRYTYCCWCHRPLRERRSQP